MEWDGMGSKIPSFQRTFFEEGKEQQWQKQQMRLNVYSTVTYTPKNCTPIVAVVVAVVVVVVWSRSVHHIERSYSFTICS